MWCQIHGDLGGRYYGSAGKERCAICRDERDARDGICEVTAKPPEPEVEVFRRGQLFMPTTTAPGMRETVMILCYVGNEKIALVGTDGRYWGEPAAPHAVRFEGNDVWFSIPHDSALWNRGRSRLVPTTGKLVLVR